MGRAAWAADLAGRRLGEFELVEPIGQGSFGVVFRAEQALLQREAVVKVARAPGTDAAANRAVSRFLAEARLASRIDHPFAAHVYAFGAESDGILWIAMELVRGTPLDRLIEQQGPMPVERAIPFLRRLCEVVHQAHEQGIVHRDLKPANVMVVARGGTLFPKLLDLGVARDLNAATEERGNVVGTPLYMAPEQWVNAREVTSAADIYALGAMTYELLTGLGIFEAPTVQAMAGKHALTPPPALPGEFPEGLSAAIQRALAKRPGDRFPTALAFSEAMVATSGIAIDSFNLPGLDELTRDEVLMHGPQPIAEAVAAYEASRTPALARSALWLATRVIGKYVALVALACRSRTGSGRLGDTPAVLELLAALRRGTLDGAQWWKLARELVRPFAPMPDVHPVPELVGLFFEQQAELRTPMDLLLESRAREPGADASPEELRGFLVGAVPALASTLRSLRFLHDYKLVVANDGRDELWMGVRRPIRTATQVVRRTALSGSIMAASVAGLPALRASLLPTEVETFAAGSRSPEEVLAPSPRRRPGPVSVQIAAVREAAHVVDDAPAAEPMLISRDGVVVVSLWPLLQIAPPSPGYPLELFMLDGHGRNGARLLSASERLERSDDGVWPRLGLGSIEADLSTLQASDDTPPYRGLATFTEADAGTFFGREREVEGFVNRLATMPFIAIVGPSGAGKSSFVQAGVLPTLGPAWTSLVVRPGPTPLAALVANLKARGIELDAAALRGSPALLGVALRRHAADTGASLLLVVDQFEELVTLCLDEGEQEAYASALTSIATDDAAVRVVITMRDDFLVRVAQLPSMRQRLATSLQILTTPAAADLLRILTEPARRAGYAFEDEALPREMVDEVAAQPAALALLSFTAYQLWQFRDRHFKQLPRKAYLALGGVGGALAQHAEATLDAMAEPDRAVVREVFRHLVTAGGTRAVLSRAELLQVSGGASAAGAIEQLIGARLLVAMDRGGGSESIEVVHEALLSAWPRLVQWRQADAESARLRDQLRVAARQWAERGRSRGLLWRGEALAEYTLWRKRYPGALTTTEEDFGRASVADAARGRRLRRGALIVVGVGLVIALAVFARLRTKAEASRAIAVASQAKAEASEAKVADQLTQSYLEQGRAALLAGDTSRSLVYLNAAFQRGVDTPGLRFMLARGLHALGQGAVTLRGHEGLVWSVAFNPDGARLATIGSDGTARIWEAATGKQQLELGGIARAGRPLIAWANGGRSVITADGLGVLKSWDTQSGVAEKTLPGHVGAITSLGVSANGSTLVSGGADGTVRLWNLLTGTMTALLPAPLAPGITASARLVDGDRQVVVVYNGMGLQPGGMRLWTPATNALVAFRGHTSRIGAAALDPTGRWLASGSVDRTARIWDAATGAQVRQLNGHDDSVMAVAWHPAGTLLATGGADAVIKLWDPATGEVVASLRGHTAAVNRLVFISEGRELVSISADGTTRVWDVQRGVQVASYLHGGFIADVQVSPGERQLATASWRGTVKVWGLKDRELMQTLRGKPVDDPYRVPPSLSPGGRALFRHYAAGAEAWDLATGRVIDMPTGTVALPVSTSRDGGVVAVAGTDGVVHLFDGAGRALRDITAGAAPLVSCRVDPAGTRVVTASDAGEVNVWSVATGRREVTATLDGVDDVTFLAGGTRLVASFVTDADRVVARAYDVASLSAQGPIAEDVSALQAAPGEDAVAIGVVGAGVDVWTFAPGAITPTTTRLAGDVAVTALAWTLDGRRLVLAHVDGTVTVWDPRLGTRVAVLDAHDVAVYAVSVSSDGRLAVSTASNAEIKVWDLGDFKQVGSLRAGTGTTWAGFGLEDNVILSVAGETTDAWAADRFGGTPLELSTRLACDLGLVLEGEQIKELNQPQSCQERSVAQ